MRNSIFFKSIPLLVHVISYLLFLHLTLLILATLYSQIYGLRRVFGEDLKNLMILNTKGFTGHPMGVSFEDVVACEVLVTGKIPPIANFVQSETDPHLGELKFSRGGDYPCKYAMRFAAGFGSQIALALYGVDR